MGGKLNIYDMAAKGVNVTADPIHLVDGELTKAQNWQTDPVLKQGAIRRRDGIAKLNTVALAGAVTGLSALPLPDLSLLTRYFYEAWDDDSTGPSSNTFRTSTNGTSWTTQTFASIPQKMTKLGTAIDPLSLSVRYAVLNNKIYYPGNDYVSTGATATSATIHVYDGTTDFVLCQIPLHPLFNFTSDFHGVLSIVPYSSELLAVTTYDGNDATGRGRVFLLDITTGQITQLAVESALAGAPIGLCCASGRIYVGTFINNGGSGKVYQLTVGDATLVDLTAGLASGEGVTDIIVFKGNVYVSTAGSGVPVFARIRKYTVSTAAWSTVATSGDNTLGNRYGPFIVTQDGSTLLVFFGVNSVGLINNIQSSTDGTSWSIVFDINAVVGALYPYGGRPVLDANGDIYWVIYNLNQMGAVLKRTVAGVWSVVNSPNAAIRLRGPLNRLLY